jgi:serine phosphatase RsbU (regulator of sigma subunit)/tetratricopeptide (TPR) repeat protein
MAHWLIDIGWRYTYVNIDSSLHYNNKALQVAKKAGHSAMTASSLNNLGIDYYVVGNFKKAIAYLDEAYHLHKKLGNMFGMFQVQSNIGACYNLLGQRDEAIKAFKAARDLAISMKKDDLLPGIELNLSAMYLDQGKTEEAGGMIRHVISESRKLENKMIEGAALSEYGRYHNKKNNLDSALKFYTEGYNLMLEMNQEVNSVQDLANIAEIYLKKQEPKKALNFALKARDLAEANGMLNEVANSYGQLTYIYPALGDYKKGWESAMSFKQFTDSIFNTENSKAVSDIKTKFQVELKEAELNARADAEKKLLLATAEEERKRQRIILSCAIAILLVISVFSFFLFRKFREANFQKKIIEEQKAEVEAQHRLAQARAVELNIKKQELETKNKEVYDSITYARNIQSALLPGEAELLKQLGESFILFEPKDIIAGDFYWFKKINEHSFCFAVGDCTGHGVPGALMSVLGLNLLDAIYSEDKNLPPSQMLDELRSRIIRALQASSGSGKVNDGMDISLLKIDFEKKIMIAAMANNPVVVIRNDQLIELKPDKMWIGQSDNSSDFKEERMDLQSGDMIYLFSDGFKDQFGGGKGKKLKHKDFVKQLTAVSPQSAAAQKESLINFLKEWKGNLEQTDDICVGGIRVT